MGRILVVLLSAFFEISMAFAKPDPAAFSQALQASALINVLKMPVPPTQIREALLTQARPEDLTFVKSMLVQWKKNSSQNITTEFNHLILRDESGVEIFRIAPVENSPGQFEINSRVWSAPEKGSILASLKKHLANKKDAVSIFDLVSRAYADGKNVMEELISYLYYMGLTQPDFGALATSHLLKSNAAKHFSLQNNFFQDFFSSLGMKAPEVTCGSESATGRLVIENEIMSFAVRKDGDVVLTPYPSKKPFLAAGNRFRDFNGGVRYLECEDDSCSRTVGPAYGRINRFLRLKQPVEVEVAYALITRDGDQSRNPIKFNCPDLTQCDAMAIKDPSKLSPGDLERASKLTATANNALAEAKTKQNSAIQAIRPLYECCLSEKCKTEVLKVGIVTKNATEAGKATRH